MIDFNKKMKEEQKRRLAEDFDFEDSPKKKRIRIYSIMIIAAIVIFSGKIIMSSPSANTWLQENTFWGKIMHLIESPERKLFGEKDDRINILLLGVGGDGHEGSQLADTIMLASLRPSTKEVALISLPRDLTAPNQFGQWRKINSINALAEASQSGSGGQVSAEVVGNFLGEPIKYYIRLDFSGFVKIIDELGGIEVEVENTLSDYRYPIEGEEDNPDYYARFEHLYIPEGLQKMDGSLALKYVRSRYASGIEGSDFARARRQQLVLSALKDKLLSLDMLLKPAMLTKIVTELDRSIHTNLAIWEMVRLWNDYKHVRQEYIINHVFDDGPGGMLVASRGQNGAFILVPRSGNFNQIREYVNNVFNQTEKIREEPIVNEEQKEIVISKDYLAKTVVINGTWISGLAANTASNLERAGFLVIDIGNAPARDHQESKIYDLTFGRKNQELEKILNISGAEMAYDAPDWINEYRDMEKQPDFILLLGDDHQ